MLVIEKSGAQHTGDDVVTTVEAFGRDLTNADELRAVVYAHLHIERLLTTFLKQAVSSPSELKKMKLSYRHTVGFALALGLKPDLGPGLRTIGRLRNTFAHTLNTELSADGAKKILTALKGMDQTVVTHYFERMKSENASLSSWPAAYSGLDPRDQFSLLAMIHFTAIYTAVLQQYAARPEARVLPE